MTNQDGTSVERRDEGTDIVHVVGNAQTLDLLSILLQRRRIVVAIGRAMGGKALFGKKVNEMGFEIPSMPYFR